MNTTFDRGSDHLELACLYALQVLPPSEMTSVEAHIAACAACQDEVARLRPTVASFVAWPTDVLRPSESLWPRLAQRLAAETGMEPAVQAPPTWVEPEWREVAPGISCKLLATDMKAHRVSMLVRLAAGVDYPPHRHAGFEELHLLHGELWIDDRKLLPGDFHRAEVGSTDTRVWSETGCTCVLTTSTKDALR